jgi:hypothetical protein
VRTPPAGFILLDGVRHVYDTLHRSIVPVAFPRTLAAAKTGHPQPTVLIPAGPTRLRRAGRAASSRLPVIRGMPAEEPRRASLGG